MGEPVAFLEDRNIGLKLVKDGRCLCVYRAGVVGPVDIRDGFFEADEKVEVVSKSFEEQVVEAGKPPRKVLIVKGVRKPQRKTYRIVLDVETGKIVRTTREG